MARAANSPVPRPPTLSMFSVMDPPPSYILDRISRMLAIIGLANLVIGVTNSINAAHIGWVNLLCATLLMYALGRIHGKKEALERERRLHE